MVIERAPRPDRFLTGQRATRVGWFGYTRRFVEVTRGMNRVWIPCKTQREWKWCDQFEQRNPE